MTPPYADSSALVKLYADEPGTGLVRKHAAFVVSALARVEVPAALWRKQRMGELSVGDAAVLTAAFEADWGGGSFLPVAPTEPVLRSAAELVARHGLRASDAIQLASALAAAAAGARLAAFLCFDDELNAAAAREGLASPE